MSKYIIFILIFNAFCFAQNSDTYSISDHKTVGNIILKRQLGQEPIRNVETNPKVEAKPNVETKQSVETNLKKNHETNLQDSTNLAASKLETPLSKEETSKTESDKENELKISQEVITNEKESIHSKDNDATLSIKEDSKNIPASAANDSRFITPDGNFKKNHGNNEHPGAVLRGFYVFLGLSILIIIYFIIKAFRLRPGAPAPTTVRKYGIVGRRSDMEMLPLPLAEEEDDDTLFDMGSQANR